MQPAFRLAGAFLLLMAASCAAPFRSDVARFHTISPTTSGSFAIEPVDPAKRGSLEFRTYANGVAAALAARGFRETENAPAAEYLVQLDYGVDNGREKIETRPGLGGPGVGYSGYGYPYWGRYYGYYGGWYDPYWGPWGAWDYPEVYSYTEYASHLELQMKERGGRVVFEGRALAETTNRDLTRIVPKLVTAMFADFPGVSGQTVRVSIDEKGAVKTKAATR